MKARAMTYQTIDHCHRDPSHGKPVHSLRAGTARCRTCGWKGRLRKAEPEPDPFCYGHGGEYRYQDCLMPVSIQRGGGWPYK